MDGNPTDPAGAADPGGAAEASGQAGAGGAAEASGPGGRMRRGLVVAGVVVAAILAVAGTVWAATADGDGPIAAGSSADPAAADAHHDHADTGTDGTDVTDVDTDGDAGSGTGLDTDTDAHDHGHDDAAAGESTGEAAADANETASAGTCEVGGTTIDPDHNDHQVESHGLTLHDETGGVVGASDCADAQAFYDAVVAGTSVYADIDAARAAGYVVSRSAVDDGMPLDHYMLTDRDATEVDPTQPEGLVYYVDGDRAVLMGAVFIERGDDLPQPGGAYTVWHDHHDSGCPADRPDCTRASAEAAPRMLHVWFFDGVADPFAHSFREARKGGVDA